MPARIDLTNMSFGDWKVLEYVGNKRYRCQCSCGEVKVISGQSLRTGTSTSCGHNTTGFKDLSGQNFDYWHVDSYAGIINGRPYYNCTCKCGTQSKIWVYALKRGTSMSCGCKQKQMPILDLSNKQFFDWTVLECVGIENNRSMWRCRCVCGVERIISGASLVAHQTKSCGHNTGISNAEKEVADFIKSLGFTVIENDKTILNGKELDIYIPDRKLAVEYNGSYWHNSAVKGTDYHKNKTLGCAQKGIDLVHIFDYEWKNEHKRHLIENLLKTKLGLNEKIYARNTEVKQVSLAEASKFTNENHLQGHVNFDTAFGLYYNDVLVEVMTFGFPRFSADNDVELLRLCTKVGYTVVGGANKLFKHFLVSAKNVSIISYCNLAKFNGKVYKQLGMTYDGITQPNYVYVNNQDLLDVKSRYQCQKKKLIELGWGTEEQTETDIMLANNYSKIYDCGNARYIYYSK